MSRNYCLGFTMLEFVIAIAILGILVTAALPPMREIIQNNRLTTATNELIADFNLARSFAVTKRNIITICPGTTNPCASGASWHEGWTIIDDLNNVILKSHEPLDANVEITVTNGGTGEIEFNSAGSANTQPNLLIKTIGCIAESARQITISPTGRPTSSTLACTV